MSLDFVRAVVADAPVGVVGDVGTLRAHIGASGAPGDTIECAALAGVAARSVGWAFAGGYQAALARLDGGRGTATATGLRALCATEEGGAHPRSIMTSLVPAHGGGWVLSGHKTFVTMGTDADVLYVVASTCGVRAEGAGGLGRGVDGRKQLRVARVDARAAGVSLRAHPPLPFVPEVAHSDARFDGVRVADDDLLPGDGYEDALKLFRTIEDLHVTAAVVGWAAGVARASSWERAWIERAAAILVLLRALGEEVPSGAETHVALAGALAEAGQLLDGAPWDRAEAATRAGWERDRALLQVAGKVRSARLETAWRHLASNFQAPPTSNGT